jgi:hypothetical protein
MRQVSGGSPRRRVRDRKGTRRTTKKKRVEKVTNAAQMINGEREEGNVATIELVDNGAAKSSGIRALKLSTCAAMVSLSKWGFNGRRQTRSSKARSSDRDIQREVAGSGARE